MSKKMNYTKKAIGNQLKCIDALLIRHVMMKYGREKLGFLWVAIEPMLLTAGVLTIWTLLKGTYDHGIKIVEMVLTGYMLLTLWRHITNSMIHLIKFNVSLMYHSRITVIDIFLSRSIVDDLLPVFHTSVG